MGRSRETDERDPLVSAVILAFNRKDAIEIVLQRVAELPVDEVVVVDNGSDGASEFVARAHPDVRVVSSGGNAGVAGRNRGVEVCRGRYVLMLDDDCYPLPGAVEKMVEVLEAGARVGAVGGFVRDVDATGRIVRSTELGTFDWFLRGNRTPAGDGTIDAFFFPEGASMVRREAFAQVGGFFEPYFFTHEGLDLATRLLAAGWDVRYVPDAPFDHMKAASGRDTRGALKLRIRNEIWYFYLRFPLLQALWRISFYLVFDLVECLYRRAPEAWSGGIVAAWRGRAAIRGQKAVVPKRFRRRIELDRRRLHLALLLGQLKRRASRGVPG